MADDDSRSEEEKIQAMFQQSSDQWNDQQDNISPNVNPQSTRSPQQFRMNPNMMNMAMMNPQLQYQQRLQQMLMQQQFQRQQQQMQRHMSPGQSTIPPESQKPPIGYVCFKCGQPGHWIYYCPNVPKGQFVPRPGMNGNGTDALESQTRQKPTELTCRLCKKLMVDAVLVPCCGKSFCKECICATLDNTNRCPLCSKENVSSSQVIPNRSLRNTIQAFIEEREKEEKAQAEMEQTTESGTVSENGEKPMQSVTEKEEHATDVTSTTHAQQPQSAASQGGLPIQVFESEERTTRAKHKGQDGMMDVNMMFGANPAMMMGGLGGPPGDMYAGGANNTPEMAWMGMMGMPPPGMNTMMRMGMVGPEQWGFGMNEGMGDMLPDMDMPQGPMSGRGMGRPPFMMPGGGFVPEEMWNTMNGPFPGMPPQDMFPFGPGMSFNARGGFAGGRGRGRGGRYPNQSIRRRSDQGAEDLSKRAPGGSSETSTTEKPASIKGVAMVNSDEDIPTGPRAERENYTSSQTRYEERSSSSTRYRRRSRSRSPRRESRRRSTSRSPSRSPERSRHRSSSRTSSPRGGGETSPHQRKDRHSSSSSKHRSSRHHSSRYRSRDRDRDRERDRDHDRDRERERERERERLIKD
ncbi:E3 ubiquitin-protein ligase rbbp6 [Apophysomyces ossiformis]|uniref:E3 ubiquitin-protein ligase rbbp6 n=1 Tax=Apophysomyces ossiformis TaxID=679940 RepID=A0A8H7BMZ4_9FUNG|nr:E3 ubiquitin-protein ligase rbbp6 [Apophysomyces ossiformis]